MSIGSTVTRTPDEVRLQFLQACRNLKIFAPSDIRLLVEPQPSPSQVLASGPRGTAPVLRY